MKGIDAVRERICHSDPDVVERRDIGGRGARETFQVSASRDPHKLVSVSAGALIPAALTLEVPRFSSRFVKLDDAERRLVIYPVACMIIASMVKGVRVERDKLWLWLGIAGAVESRDVQWWWR